MTNEKYAEQIAYNLARPYLGMEGDDEITSFEECELSAIQMAEWKDKQFKEYLEKKRAKVADAYSENTSDFKAGGLHMVFEIINELFKEE